MTDLILYGLGDSVFARTAILACLEKGVPYEVRAVGAAGSDPNAVFAALKTPEYLKLHPFGRMPAMRHGDFTLFESVAIARYVDEAFEGPALQPAELQERAVMNQWISAINDYIVADMVRRYIGETIFGSEPDGVPDEDKLKAYRPRVRAHFELLDAQLAGRTYLASDRPTIADLHLLPIAHMVGALPGGLALIDKLPNLARWWEAMSRRDSFKASMPPMFAQAAA